MPSLVELNPDLDKAALSAAFARTGRMQVRDVLSPGSAAALRDLLVNGTPWGLAWQAGAANPPQLVRAEELSSMAEDRLKAICDKAAADVEYGFAYYSYPLVTAYLQRWSPGGPHDRLLEQLNATPVLDFIRLITGIPEIVKMDGQATLYGPRHFLRMHNDAQTERGRRVAYVLNMTLGEWQPHWGGYLNFFDDDWDVEQAFRPRFNSLNLFCVPQWHSVSEVTSVAPQARYAITGWARDR
jgi:SM-20-related protein